MSEALTESQQQFAATEIRRQRQGAGSQSVDSIDRSNSGIGVAGVKSLGLDQVKTSLKDWLIDYLVPLWGGFKWFSARMRGEKMGANSWLKLVVLLSENIFVIFAVLAILAIFVIIVSFISNPWKMLVEIFNLGWSGINALVSLFTGS